MCSHGFEVCTHYTRMSVLVCIATKLCFCTELFHCRTGVEASASRNGSCSQESRRCHAQVGNSSFSVFCLFCLFCFFRLFLLFLLFPLYVLSSYHRSFFSFAWSHILNNLFSTLYSLSRFYQMDKTCLQDHIGKIRAALCDKGIFLFVFCTMLIIMRLESVPI